MKYCVVKIFQKRKLTKTNLVVDGYKMNPKLKLKKDFIEVNHIIISNDQLQQNTLNRQFHIAYRKLFTIVVDTLESTDATEGDTKLALNEIVKMKRVLETKYQQKIDKKNYKEMYRKTEILEQKLQEKLMVQQNARVVMEQMMMVLPEQEKGIYR